MYEVIVLRKYQENRLNKVNDTIKESCALANIPEEYHNIVKLIVWEAIRVYKNY